MRRGENSCLRLNPFHLLLWGSLGKAREVKPPVPMDPGLHSQPEPGFASEDQNSLEIQGGSPSGYLWGWDGGSGCALCPQLCPHIRLEGQGWGLGVTKGCAGSGLCSGGPMGAVPGDPMRSLSVSPMGAVPVGPTQNSPWSRLTSPQANDAAHTRCPWAR